MRDYELVFIAHPDLDETALTELVNKVKGWITDGGGTVANVDVWGKRRLAYTIRKQKDGQYVMIRADIKPEFCATLERNLRLAEPVLRYMLITNES